MEIFNLKELLKERKDLLLQGKFGLERENLRVDSKALLSDKLHPSGLGDKGSHAYITTDFSESQLELITPPLDSIEESISFLKSVEGVVFEQLDADEYLWPQSSPSLLPDEELIPIALYGGESREKEAYRAKLKQIYGAKRQTYSGVHFNYSFPLELTDLFDNGGEELYLKSVRNFMRHRWVLIWLFGASPKFDKKSVVDRISEPEVKSYNRPCKEAISLRVSKSGYRNKRDFILDYSSINNYKESVNKLVEGGELFSANELYVPIRFKFNLKNPDLLSHIEVRTVDIDPFEPAGVSSDTLHFIHLFLTYMAMLDEDGEFNEDAQKRGTEMHDVVSCAGRCQSLSFLCGGSVLEKMRSFIKDMEQKLSSYNLLDNSVYNSAFQNIVGLTLDPDKRVGVRVAKGVEAKGFVPFHMDLAKEYKKNSIAKRFNFSGFEDLELSTQLLLRAAVLRGISFDIVDRGENFIRLHRGEEEQFVIQATKTSLDNYSSILLMENKVATKWVLKRSNISVPNGAEYNSLEEAESNFSKWSSREIVIKPKSTNFGLGITIFKDGCSRENYSRALKLAFTHDSTVMIEEFVHGREFRFFVMDDSVVGILHRVPANITGNGVATIADLIEEKNQDPLRGKGYKTPLEKIAMGEAEEMFLAEQGLDFSSTIPKGEIVYLRENSNISTGGDSLDFTDDIHESYKEIAVAATKAMGVRITGLDMMIPDIKKPADSGSYSIIEMNFNPAIHIHCYPFKGKNRELNIHLIDMLFS